MDENYCALALAILYPIDVTVENAFEFLGYGRPWVIQRKSRKSHSFTDEDTRDMVRMREAMTYQEIANVYGCDKHAVFARVKRWRGATGSVARAL